MKRREFIAGLGGALVWPVTARTQQGDRVRRIGVLMPENNPGAKARISAFTQTLEDFGWTDGRNMRIDLRIDIPPLPSREKSQGAMGHLLGAARPARFGGVGVSRSRPFIAS